MSVAFKGYDILANQVILVTLVVKAYLYPKKKFALENYFASDCFGRTAADVKYGN